MTRTVSAAKLATMRGARIPSSGPAPIGVHAIAVDGGYVLAFDVPTAHQANALLAPHDRVLILA